MSDLSDVNYLRLILLNIILIFMQIFYLFMKMNLPDDWLSCIKYFRSILLNENYYY